MTTQNRLILRRALIAVLAPVCMAYSPTYAAFVMLDAGHGGPGASKTNNGSGF
jgi:hypothetical protein